MKLVSKENIGSHPYRKDAWCLTDSVRSVLDRQIAHLPKRAVPDHEIRYPVDRESMRAFLETFFTRHLFQVQNSLIDDFASPDFQETVRSRPLRVFDSGSGPAIASLGIMDLFNCTVDAIGSSRLSLGSCRGRTVHVLNDSSRICLATGTQMLVDYFQYSREHGSPASEGRVFTLQTEFPGNVNQIYRLALALGGYDIVILSYVMNPLAEKYGLQSLVTAVKRLEHLCTSNGRLLIVQDRFQERLVRTLSRMLDVPYRKRTVIQEIYPCRGRNETYTYTYCESLYMPRRKDIVRPSCVG